jgi:hypothetical protein
MYCYLIEDFTVSVMIRLRFLAFTQDHTDVMLFIRGFYRFSDDTPTFSCFLAFTQDHTDVLLFNRAFSRLVKSSIK